LSKKSGKIGYELPRDWVARFKQDT